MRLYFIEGTFTPQIGYTRYENPKSGSQDFKRKMETDCKCSNQGN